tara:strand:+ start:1151 stop:3829 length:2679 start_codon:yes stop_codon:yes gene_type:complete
MAQLPQDSSSPAGPEQGSALSDPGPQNKPLNEPVVQRIAVQAGFSAYVPRRWGIISCEVWNPTDESHDLTIRANWKTEDLTTNAIQFTRNFTVPPKVVRVVSYPIRIPDHELNQKRLKLGNLELNSRITRIVDGREVAVLSPLKTPLDLAQITTDFNKPALGFMAPDPKDLLDNYLQLTNVGVDVEMIDSVALRMLKSIKDEQQAGIAVFVPQGGEITATSTALDALDQLVIADKRVIHDVALMATIRQWVANGGRLWIMLNETGVELPQRLFGDSISIAGLGSEHLSQVEIISKHSGQEPVVFDYDEPIHNAIVYAEDVEVYHEVNGMPSSFWKKYGNGEVLFTTLEARGLTLPKPFSTANELLLLVPLQDLALRFFKPTEKAMTDVSVTQMELAAMTPEDGDQSDVAQDMRIAMETYRGTSRVDEMSEYLVSKVGFEIVAREHIAVVFGLFFLFLCGTGVVLYRKGRLELMLLVAPGLVLIVCTYLYFVGVAKRHTLENLMASIQFINAENQARDLPVRGFGAVYSEESLDADIHVSNGTIFWPDFQELTGQNIRMVWNDLQSWHWEGLQIPGGTVRTFPFEKRVASESPVFASASFGEVGLQGKYELGPLTNLEHGLLVSPTGERVSVQFVDGNLIIGSQDLADSQFDTTSSLVDEETGNRINFINALLKRQNADVMKYPQVPSIFVWSDPLDLGIEFPGEQKVIGSALTVCPLKILKTPPGQKFVVPSIMTSFYPSNAINGLGASYAYDFTKDRWNDEKINRSHQMWLKIKVPSAVSPATITKAIVTVDIQAGERVVNSVGRERTEQGLYKPVILDTRKSPNGQEVFLFDNAEHLAIDEDGFIFLGINIGLDPIPGESEADQAEREKDYFWQIKDVDVSLEGTVNTTH